MILVQLLQTTNIIDYHLEDLTNYLNFKLKLHFWKKYNTQSIIVLLTTESAV